MGDTLFYQYIDRLSLFYNYFAFLDTDAYLADQLFIKHQVRVHFCEEYVRGDSPYRVIFCHVRKRDRARFQAALEELPKKMMYAVRFGANANSREKRRRIPVKQLIPLDKRSKKAKREYHAKQRGSWNGVNPVTRIVQSRKAYDRARVKQSDRRDPRID